MNIPNIHTLYTDQQIRKGVMCPCCEKNFKINSKKFNRTMLQYLEALSDHQHEGFIKASRLSIKARAESSVDAPSKEIRTGDYKMLLIWGLADVNDENKMMINRQGIDFLNGETTISEGVLLENNKNKFVAFVGDQVYVDEVRKTAFSVEEL